MVPVPDAAKAPRTVTAPKIGRFGMSTLTNELSFFSAVPSKVPPGIVDVQVTQNIVGLSLVHWRFTVAPAMVVSTRVLSKPTFVAFVRAGVHEETTLLRPTSAACIAFCVAIMLRPTRYSCVEAKNTPAITAPTTTIAASAIGRAIPSRVVARTVLGLDMVYAPNMVTAISGGS
jgi:hypothetical protein